jgi:hypothetical protein
MKYAGLISVAGSDCEIVQISAWCGETSFMLHVMPPTKQIDPKASAVNKIVIRDGKMYHSEKFVDAVDRSQALCEFAQFISGLGDALVLVAHNGVRFDFPR